MVPTDRFAEVIAQRAIDLSRDGDVRVSDCVEHLQRLAQGRRTALESAHRSLGARSAAPEPYASMLLERAIAGLPGGGASPPELHST